MSITVAITRRLSQRSEPALAIAAATVTLTVITAAELLTTYANPVSGMALHALLLSALIIAGGMGGAGIGDETPPLSRLLYSLTLVPLIRILSLSMPLTRFDQTYWYLMAGLPVLAAILVVTMALGLHFRDIGLCLGRRPFLQLLVIALGFGLGVMEHFILNSEPLIDELTLRQFLVPALILLVATGFLEELLFRGVLQRTALPVLGPVLGLVYVSLIFAILHIGYRSALDVAFVFAIALIYAWAVRKTGSILGVSLSHGLTNIMLFLVAPFIDALSIQGPIG
ncbi:MAG: lysostaphin resistance A-like protein [Dehalococcoidia bacterium]